MIFISASFVWIAPCPPPSNMTWLNDEMAGQTDAGEDESEIASWDVRVERRGE